MELEVLRGAADTLKRFRPVVIFETMAWAQEHRQKSGVDLFEIARLLDSLDYSGYTLTDAGVLPVDWQRPATNNTLALPRRQ